MNAFALAVIAGIAMILPAHAQSSSSGAMTAGAPIARHPPVPHLDVPFVTTPDRVVELMLSMARVGPRDTVIDLGSGYGRIVIAAALRHGAQGLGVEVDPKLVAESNARARSEGVADRVRFVEQDLFTTDLSRASVITMYLLPKINLRLRPKLLQLKPGTRIVSHDWDMGDWLPDQRIVLGATAKKRARQRWSQGARHENAAEENALMLWTVPAKLGGTWRVDDGLTIVLDQKYQQLTGRATWHGQVFEAVTGVIDGDKVRLCLAMQDEARCRVGARGQLNKGALGLQIVDAAHRQIRVVARRLRPSETPTTNAPAPTRTE